MNIRAFKRTFCFFVTGWCAGNLLSYYIGFHNLLPVSFYWGGLVIFGYVSIMKLLEVDEEKQ